MGGLQPNETVEYEQRRHGLRRQGHAEQLYKAGNFVPHKRMLRLLARLRSPTTSDITSSYRKHLTPGELFGIARKSSTMRSGASSHKSRLLGRRYNRRFAIACIVDAELYRTAGCCALPAVFQPMSDDGTSSPGDLESSDRGRVI